ncbi:MAG: substrate-binding domain-containing protein [Lachnospiraceae bacterium]|nr:substrate-binding domain-containing protein [Lachnospiraceae bacterium]
MKRKTAYILLICLTFLCITLCPACSGKKDNNAPLPISHFEPLNEIKAGRKNVYLIIKVMDSSYWKVIVNGARDAGEVLDCNIYYGGTTIETDWEGQQVLINEALESKADAMIIAPDDSIELAADINRIHDLGKPVVLIDTAANTNSFDICYMTDNLLAGQQAAAEMLNQLKRTGHDTEAVLSVGIMVGSAKSQTINERLAGFYKYWTENAPEKWTIISDIMNCNGKVDLGFDLARDFLKQHPETAGLYGTNNGPTRAICGVVKEQSRTDLVVVGFDYSDEMKELIELPEYPASTMLQRQYDMGNLAVGSVMDLLNGDTPPLKFVDTGVVTVNTDTLSDPEVTEVLERN